MSQSYKIDLLMFLKYRLQKLYRNMFLILLLLVLQAQSEILTSTNSCLGHCSSCLDEDPSFCTLGPTGIQCDSISHPGKSKGNCQISPTMKILGGKEQFAIQRENQTLSSGELNWNSEKHTKCQITGKKKQNNKFQALGIFSKNDTISKQITIPSKTNFLKISFNFLHDSYAPSNQFFLISIIVGKQSYQYEVYTKRKQVNQEQGSIKCREIYFKTQQYHLEIPTFGETEVLINFKGTLFEETYWGLASIAIIIGCSDSVVSLQGKTCSACDSGFYKLVNQNNNLLRCQKCPQQCLLCQSQEQCTLCEANFQQKNGLCVQRKNDHNIQQSSLVKLQNENNIKENKLQQLVKISKSNSFQSPEILVQVEVVKILYHERLNFSLNQYALVAQVQNKLGMQPKIKNIFQSDDKFSFQLVLEESLKDAKINIFLSEKNIKPEVQTLVSMISGRSLQELHRFQSFREFDLHRYDYVSPSEVQTLKALKTFLEIICWTIMIAMFMSALSDNGVAIEQLYQASLLIHLHGYIDEYQPVNFRYVLGGLVRLLNHNFFSSDLIQSLNQSQPSQTPLNYAIYGSTNYLNKFLPILLILGLYIIWFVFMLALKSKMKQPSHDPNCFQRIVYEITTRKVNYTDQSWRYLSLGVFWLLIVEIFQVTPWSFLKYIFILGFTGVFIGWPVFFMVYCRYLYYQLQYQEYLFALKGSFFLRIPNNYLPSLHHRNGYYLLKFIKLIIFAIIIALFREISAVALFLLALLQFLQIAYCYEFQIFLIKKLFYLKIAENSLFILLDLLLLSFANMEEKFSTEVYLLLGYVLISCIFFIIFTSFLKALFYAKYCCKQLFGEEINYEEEAYIQKSKRIV